MLYAVTTPKSNEAGALAAYRLDTGEERILIRGGAFPAYAPTGPLVYYPSGTIMAVPLDTSRLEVIGSPTQVVEDVGGGALFPGSAFPAGDRWPMRLYINFVQNWFEELKRLAPVR